MPGPQFVKHNNRFGINPIESPSGWVIIRVLLSALVFLMIPGATHAQVSFFTPPTYTGAGNLFTADFNGDGKPDLLSSDGTMQLGKGDGTFTKGTPITTGNPLAVADFNGDGKPDVLEQGTGTLLVLLGNGDGTFQAPISTNSGAGLQSISTGDLNGDGKADVVGVFSHWLFVYLSNGDGTFASGKSYDLGSLPPGTLVLGDFNGDHKTDVAVLTAGNNVPGQVLTFLGNGDGDIAIAEDLSRRPLSVCGGCGRFQRRR